MKNPTWRSNLAIFITISIVVIGYFFWQEHRALQQFSDQAREHSRILAAVVEKNISNVVVSNNGLETVIKRFLENSARFVGSLDETERFTESELSAFAGESGLAGVKIIHRNGQDSVSGPPEWLPDIDGCSPGLSICRKIIEAHLGQCSCRVDHEKGFFSLCITLPIMARELST